VGFTSPCAQDIEWRCGYGTSPSTSGQQMWRIDATLASGVSATATLIMQRFP
jgi:hypothetical protein